MIYTITVPLDNDEMIIIDYSVDMVIFDTLLENLLPLSGAWPEKSLPK